MTVKEMIQALQRCYPEAIVVTVCGESSFRPVTEMKEIVYHDPDTGPMIYDDNGDVIGPVVTLDWR